ncbi:MAG: 4-(cytidine 5'-diphospho)-2-C-methyl-D-erythritol kinase [Acidobacteria bacterium]|nr:4-(cytidine 5'-diphospho)-2-C-methyl-D-erythritol kinase [Acidobacteriota bacterium]
MSFSLPSFAKINWTLRVLGKRDDGFHELFTVFQTVSLCDVIYFAESEKLELTCEDAAIPTDGRNLIVQAARALQRVAGLNKGAFIHLEKRIPSPGGLGGGSSNAAVALIGLMQLWDVTVGERELNEIALELGSDVPFFLQGGTAIGTGRGEVIETIDDRETGAMLIVTPDVDVSTREAFAGLDAATLTNVDLNRILPVCRKDADGLDPLHSVLTNDFERSVFSAYPEIGRVKKTLIDLGAITAAMSGSGASVFAVFDKKETRQAAEKALDREITWRKFVVSTISRD